MEKLKTHILCSIFIPENRAVCEIMYKNVVERCRQRMTIWRIRISRWVRKSAETHSEHVIPYAYWTVHHLDI